MKKTVLSLALVLTVIAAPAGAQSILTQWNFNSPSPDGNTSTGTISPSMGLGTASLVGGVTASFASGDASGGSSDPASGDDSGWNLTTFASQGTGDRTRGAQFMISTVGFKDLVLNYDLRHSNTSSRYEQVQYTLNGTDWSSIGTLFDGNLGDTWFNGRTIDLTSVTAANDNASFGLRVVAAFAPSTTAYVASSPTGTYGTSGTWRFDMVTLSGTAIPEPSVFAALAGLMSLGLVAPRRRFRA